jgi:hypothetical protein
VLHNGFHVLKIIVFFLSFRWYFNSFTCRFSWRK